MTRISRSHGSCCMSLGALSLLLVLVFGAATPAGAGTCSAPNNCEFFSCRSPARGVPSQLWGDLRPVDTGQLPDERDSTNVPVAVPGQPGASASRPVWMSLDIENNWLFAGIAHGIQLWDMSVPTNPSLVTTVGPSAFEVWPDDGHEFFPLRSIDAPPGNDQIVGVGIGGLAGVAIVSTANKNNPVLKYQDFDKNGEFVHAATINGRNYLFAATKNDGLLVYDMTQAAALSTLCTEDTPTSTCGVYKGRVGTQTGTRFVAGVGNASATSYWVAVSAGTSGSWGLQVYDVSTPTSPALRLSGLSGFTEFPEGLAMWRSGSTYYLAVRNQTQFRIYDVSCIATGSCSGLGSPLFTANHTSGSTENNTITFSTTSGRNFIYIGGFNRCSAAQQDEWLYDVTNPASSFDITPQQSVVLPGETTPSKYWGYYYRPTPTGFNNVAGKVGKFRGNFFYRAAFSILDIHELDAGGPPDAAFIYAPSTVYSGQQIDFTDTSTSQPTQWSWTFENATPGTSTTQNPQNVVFNSLGSQTVCLTASNGFGSNQHCEEVSVLDPTPSITSVSVSPNPAFRCQPITFTGNGVTGSPSPTLSWVVRDSSNQQVAAGGNVNPFVWDSTGALAGTYTATLTATNTAGSDTATSPTLTLNALPTLPTGGSFTPTNDPFDGGPTVDFHLSVAGATAWCWSFGDSTNFPTGCASNAALWSTDPIAGPNPSHTYTAVGTYQVTVQIRNCVEAARTSAPLQIQITEVTPLEAHFQASGGVFCTGLGCFGTQNTPIGFNDSSTGEPEFWDYDWDGNSSYEDSGNAAPKTSHTYTATGTFSPRLRVRRGTEQNVFQHGSIEISAGTGGGTPSVSVSGPSSGQMNASLTFSASASNCSPSPSSWSWTVDGGTISGSTTGDTISVSWGTTGSKTVRATATSGGCSGTSGQKIVTISQPTGGGTLGANFTFTPANPTPGQQVSFDGSSSTGSPAAYDWAFGDNAVGIGTTITHTFAQAGTYQVRLEVSKPSPSCPPFNVCTASVTKTVVVGGQAPFTASFTTSATCGAFSCTAMAGQSLTFTSTTQNATSWSWNFGDGGTATGASVSHTFARAGEFTVVLTAQNAQSQTAQSAKIFSIEAPAQHSSVVIIPWISDTSGVVEQTSDLYLMNPTAAPIDTRITFRIRGLPEPTPPSVNRTIAPNATLYVPDVLNELFSRNNAGGFLVIEAGQQQVDPVAVSFNRTFQEDGSTYGQLVPGITTIDLDAFGGSSGGVQRLAGLFDSNERATQFGLTNPHETPASYRLRFLDHLGNVIATSAQDLQLAPWGQKQFQLLELRNLFNLAGEEDYRVEVVRVSGGTLSPFAGVFRNGTQDPSFVQASPANQSKLYLVGATSTPGFNNALFVTDTVLSNPTNQIMQLEMSFTPLGNGAATEGPVDLTLLPNETQRIEDVLFDRFDVRDSVGILTFESEGAGGLFPLVHGEVYQNSGPESRYGLFMPARLPSEAAKVNQKVVLTGLRQEAGVSNTSLLLFNPSATTATYDIIYYGLNGAELGRIAGYAVSPGGARQVNPSRHPLPAGGVAGGFSVVIQVKAGELIGGAQVVINQSNDPAYVSGAVR